MKVGDKVKIKYPGKEVQSQVLTLLKEEKDYWYVKERSYAIPKQILIKI